MKPPHLSCQYTVNICHYMSKYSPTGPAHAAGRLQFTHFGHPFSPFFRLFFVSNFGSFSDVVFGQKWVTFGPQNAPKCPQMVIHKCVSTTTRPKISFWSFFVRLLIPSIHVNERLVPTPCSFSHFHPIVTFRPPKLEKCQNWV